MTHKSLIFAYMQHCWQHYVSNLRCQAAFPISAFLFKQYCWYTEIVKSHLVVDQRKSLRNPPCSLVPTHVFGSITQVNVTHYDANRRREVTFC